MLKSDTKYLSSQQLPFPFFSQEKNIFENFYTGPNEIVVQSLKKLIANPKFIHSIYLWGHSFVGCSHLLQACAHEGSLQGLRSSYYSLKTLQKEYDPKELPLMLEEDEMICLDDLDVIVNCPLWEEILFHIYNILSTKSIPLITAAHQVPNTLGIHLADLRSRLNSGLLFQVQELNDAQKIKALQLRAELRGLVLPESVAQFLLTRLTRSSNALVDALNQLDWSSLARQRKLTIPFVKEILGL
jgi:DnaA family protein